MALIHFGFGAPQSAPVTLPVVIGAVALPPTATLPQLASTPAATGECGCDGGMT
jgi:hypothetical protein